MQDLDGKRVVATGGSEGLGLAMVEALAASGAHVTALARDRVKLAAAERVGAAVVAGDATDAAVMNSIIGDQAPDVLILNAGALEGVSGEEHVMRRYGSVMRPADFGQRVTELLADPRYASGVAYGFRANAAIMLLDA